MEDVMKRVLQILAVLFFLTSSSYSVFADGAVEKLTWYGRVSMGYAAQMDKYVEVNAGETEWDFESGMNYTVAAGYGVSHFALEAEFAYRKLDIVRRINTSGGSVGYTGDQTQVSLMMNAYFIPKPEWEISPYIGLGMGTTTISWNNVRAPGSPSIDDRDTVFTYQLIAGASYKITPEFSLAADYRYFVPGDIELDLTGGVNGKLVDQELNIISLSLRFKL
jgi:opacity protein-like surface antigen